MFHACQIKLASGQNVDHRMYLKCPRKMFISKKYFLKIYILWLYTLNMLFYFMLFCNMVLDLLLWKTAVVTNVTFEWIFSSMNRCNMNIQVILLRATVDSSYSYELKSQISHLNGFPPAWTDATCLFISIFW